MVRWIKHHKMFINIDPVISILRKYIKLPKKIRYKKMFTTLYFIQEVHLKPINIHPHRRHRKYCIINVVCYFVDLVYHVFKKWSMSTYQELGIQQWVKNATLRYLWFPKRKQILIKESHKKVIMLCSVKENSLFLIKKGILAKW